MTRADRIEIDLTGAGASRRWRIELALRSRDIGFRWRDDTLRTIAEAGDVLTSLVLLDFDEPDEDVDERPGPGSTRATPYVAPPSRVVATKVWWQFANPFSSLNLVWLVIVLVGLVVWLVQQL